LRLPPPSRKPEHLKEGRDFNLASQDYLFGYQKILDRIDKYVTLVTHKLQGERHEI